MPPKSIRGREVLSSRVSKNPKEAAMSSAASIDSEDSLLCQVKDYAEVSTLTS